MEIFRILLRYSLWVLFLLYIIIGGVFISYNSEFQASKIGKAQTHITGLYYSTTSSISSYLNLSTVNNSLAKENSELRMKLAYYEEFFEENNILKDSITTANLKLYNAKVVYNTIIGTQNYLIINKGSDDGIKKNMGVISGGCVIGITQIVSSKYTLVASILNVKTRISGKFKTNNSLGSVIWKGSNISKTTFQEVPRHIVVTEGDSIITSGFSSIFPEGILIGTVENYSIKASESYYDIELKIAADMSALRYVQIINIPDQELIEEVQKKIKEK